MICAICGFKETNTHSFSLHVWSKHKLTSEQYTIKHILNKERPGCVICSKPTAYIKGKYSFKKYCKEHTKEAQSAWGKENGFGAKIKPDWKKGLTKETSPGILAQSEKMIGEKNPMFGKRHSSEVYQQISAKRAEKMKLSQEEIKNKIEKHGQFEVLSDYSKYKNVKQKLTVKCCFCGREQEKTLFQVHQNCNCEFCGVSLPEREIGCFLEENNILFERKNREIIAPQELDFYIPSKKVAIELHGLYWHSERTKPNGYHYKKYKQCKEKDIQLIQIFSDEWKSKKEIVKSMILSRVKETKNTIFARKCELKFFEKPVLLKDFFIQNHIDGFTRSKYAFALIYENEIVSALLFREPFHKKYNNTIEISRFASKLNTQVVGGLTKLLSHSEKFLKKQNYKTILTYVDARYGNGNGYEKAGFSFLRETKMNFWYTDGKKRMNRFKFRAQAGKPEKKVAEENGVFRIFGPGNLIFEKKI